MGDADTRRARLPAGRPARGAAVGPLHTSGACAIIPLMRLLLFVVFIVVPLFELWLVIQVGQFIGAGPTIALLLAISIAGAALVKYEGLRAWRRFREALNQGRLPASEVVDGALVVFAGALLLTPGFATDTVGLLLLLPPTRAVVNRALRGRARHSLGLGGFGHVGGAASQKPGQQPGQRRADDDVLDVDVVDVQRARDDEDEHPPRGELGER